jgi:hypothetical protein
MIKANGVEVAVATYGDKTRATMYVAGGWAQQRAAAFRLAAEVVQIGICAAVYEEDATVVWEHSDGDTQASVERAFATAITACGYATAAKRAKAVRA